MTSTPIWHPWWFTDRVIRRHLAAAVRGIQGRVLDIGCGNRPYVDLLPSARLIGVDMARKPGVDLVANAQELPFSGGTFDGALCNQVLEHVSDPYTVMEEAYRVLRHGGVLVVTVPFVARLHGCPHDYWRFSEYGLRTLLEKSGFQEIQVQPLGGFYTCQAYLWLFWLWEVLSGPHCLPVRVAALLLKRLLMPPLNLASWLVYHVDHEKATPFNYLGVARKPLA